MALRVAMTAARAATGAAFRHGSAAARAAVVYGRGGPGAARAGTLAACSHHAARAFCAQAAEAAAEPVDWTSIIPDNLQLHDPQAALTPAPASAEPLKGEDTVLPVASFAAPGDVVGEVQLDSRVFGVEIREDIVHRVVQWQLAKRRTKQYKTKTISEVSGGGRKPWQQKHTGRARTGSIRGSQWRGGAKPHGPKIREYEQKLNKKVRQQGLCIALASKAMDKRLFVVDDLSMETHKTKEFIALWQQHGWSNLRVLVMDDPEFDPYFMLASGNVKRVETLPVCGANVISILKNDIMVVTPRALDGLYERLIDGFEAQPFVEDIEDE